MKIFPDTIKELNTISTMKEIRSLIVDEQSKCSNIYSPKYKELCKLYKWVSKNILDKRLHD